MRIRALWVVNQDRLCKHPSFVPQVFVKHLRHGLVVLSKSDLLQRSDLVDKEVIYCKFGIASNWLLENFVDYVALMDHVDVEQVFFGLINHLVLTVGIDDA